MRAAVAALWLVLSGPAWGQSHNHPPQDAYTHDTFYKTWMRPDAPNSSCCDKKDCYPVEARFRSGVWLAKRREDGKWLTVPPEKIERNRSSPDGRNHLCAPIPAYEAGYKNGVICFIPGAGI